MLAGQMSNAIIFSLVFMDILANPPRLTQYLCSGKSNKSPIGTKGAPCPLRETSKFLKLLMVVIFVV